MASLILAAYCRHLHRPHAVLLQGDIVGWRTDGDITNALCSGTAVSSENVREGGAKLKATLRSRLCLSEIEFNRL